MRLTAPGRSSSLEAMTTEMAILKRFVAWTVLEICGITLSAQIHQPDIKILKSPGVL